MKTGNINVNTRAIAKGIYDMIVESGNAGVVAFGMIPVEFAEMLERQLADKAAEIIRGDEQHFSEAELQDLGEIGRQMIEETQTRRDKWVKDTLHAVTCDIYAVAQDKGKMLV